MTDFERRAKEGWRLEVRAEAQMTSLLETLGQLRQFRKMGSPRFKAARQNTCKLLRNPDVWAVQEYHRWCQNTRIDAQAGER